MGKSLNFLWVISFFLALEELLREFKVFHGFLVVLNVQVLAA